MPNFEGVPYADVDSRTMKSISVMKNADMLKKSSENIQTDESSYETVSDRYIVACEGAHIDEYKNVHVAVQYSLERMKKVYAELVTVLNNSATNFTNINTKATEAIPGTNVGGK